MSNNTPAQAAARYDSFLENVRASGELWYLKRGNGAALVELEEQDVVPMWAEAQIARECAVVTFPDSVPQRLSLAEFLSDWVPDLQVKNIWVGVAWLPDCGGIDVRPDILASELRGEGAESGEGAERGQ
jgi:hypothetical protein